MEESGYNITNNEFKQISKWAENIYNIAVIVDYFVSNQPEIEECYNLTPVINNLKQNADLLNVFFIDNEKWYFSTLPKKHTLPKKAFYTKKNRSKKFLTIIGK